MPDELQETEVDRLIKRVRKLLRPRFYETLDPIVNLTHMLHEPYNGPDVTLKQIELQLSVAIDGLKEMREIVLYKIVRSRPL